jgi:hypothetical protein
MFNGHVSASCLICFVHFTIRHPVCEFELLTSRKEGIYLQKYITFVAESGVEWLKFQN